MMNTLKINGIYKHFKGMMVEVMGVAKDSETLEEMVVYRHLDTKEMWVRSKTAFLSEVDKAKYPEVKQIYRFELQDIENVK